MAKDKPIQVCVTTVSWTPGGQPVHVHYKGIVTAGPLSRVAIFHTTQADLSAFAPKEVADVDGDYWSDVEIEKALAAHLADSGLTNIEIVDNPAVMARDRNTETRERARNQRSR